MMRHAMASASRAELAPGLLLALAAAGLPGPATAAEQPHYRLDVSLDPAAHRLDVTAEVTLPDRFTGPTVDFALAGKLQLADPAPAVQTLPPAAAGGEFAGINGSSAGLAGAGGVTRYRVSLAAGQRTFRVHYAGRLDLRPEASPEEYARSFAETPGIVAPEGVYLAGSTLWYPYLGEGLVTFELTAALPAGWHLVAPGNDMAGGKPGETRWASAGAVDEISLSGGPLTVYRRPAGTAEARVYLRAPDPALADRYLEATARYLEMYRNLIGPYPYNHFALVENFWETGYGMPTYTLLGPQIIRFPFILTSSYPHEILHNWWGNSVFVDYATGNWAEGLTAYLADHLMKEQEGLGAEYRRDVLKKYRDYVGKGQDFPLREFRSRHSATTEAVGYGKTLMGFHGLRMRVGDEAFRRGLARFYRAQRGRQASFADVQAAFTTPEGPPLERYFGELTTRTGAADLAVERVGTRRQDGEYVVRGSLLQRQAGPFELSVPVQVTTATGVIESMVASSAGATPFEIRTAAEPLSLAVDPAFDVFRLLDPRETAPSIGQLFGADTLLLVLPEGAEAAPYRGLLDAWKNPAQKARAVPADELRELPDNEAVWILGRDNPWARRLFRSEPGWQLELTGAAVTVGKDAFPLAGNSVVLLRRHPADPARAVGWISAESAAAIPALGRKLPHYGKYSWLAFRGEAADNVGKGEWPATDSPLRVALSRTPPPAGAAPPRRAALAELPAAFAPDRMVADIRWLADPAREGRGFGSTGLEAAAGYIAEQFAATGLKPGGDDGTWFQSFSAQGGTDGATRTQRNIIAVLPGNDPKLAAEAALLTAHYDHLGFGWPNARAAAVGKIHPGADDNASGVAVLLELARQMAATGPRKRTLVFVAFSAEEGGLVGSHHYVQNPRPVPLAGITGVVNLDTVGRLGRQPLSVLATGSAREWPFVFRGITAVTGLPIRDVPGASQSSDQRRFIEAGIPAVQLFTGAHLDYHQPTDTADKVDPAGLVKVAVVAREALLYLADTEKRPGFTPIPGEGTPAAAAPGAAPATPTPRRASLGTIPDFAFQGPGLRLEGVVPGSPAAGAGLKPGDILTRMGGKDIPGLGGYNEILKALNPGDEVEITWQSGGTERSATVKLGQR